MSTDAFRKVQTAAAAGDREAQRALDALNAAAEAADAAKMTDGEKGLAEARRRYGPLRGDAA